MRSIFLMFLLLSGCSDLGGEARPDSFDEGEVNRLQVIRIIEIKHVSLSHMIIDHKHAPAPSVQNKSGFVVDLVMLPFNVTSVMATGSPITGRTSHDGEEVDAVGIDYIDKTDGYSPLLRSTQVGKVCEYKNGFAELVKTENNETRIQPNSKC